MKKDHALCCEKDIRNVKHLEHQKQTLTNWNGSCFSLSIIWILLFLLVAFSSFLFLFFLLSLHIHIWTGIFRQMFFPVVFQSPVSRTTWL